MGKRHVESKNIKIQKTRVQGLHAMPMEIPNIQTNDGTYERIKSWSSHGAKYIYMYISIYIHTRL